MTRNNWAILAVGAIVVALAGGLAGGMIVSNAYQDRVAAVEGKAVELQAKLDGVTADQATAAAAARDVKTLLSADAEVVARIDLTNALEPESRFGGIQAFVETGSIEHGCIASVSETNIGNLGPFYVLCTPRKPVIGGTTREGLLLQIRTASAGGRSDRLFPSGSIVQVTLWQPGAKYYRAPVVCVIGAPSQC